MANSLSVCPICRTVIKDPDQEICSRCRWSLNTENSLPLEIRNSLLEWAMCHYQRADELDRKDYNYSKLESRLNSQRDDIDRLQQIVDSLVNIPKIESVLLSEQVTIDQNANTPEIENKNVIIVNNTNLVSTLGNLELSITSQKEEHLTLSTSLLTTIEKDIISEHYYNLTHFADKYHTRTVNVTKESISTNWGSEKKNVVLEEFNRGNYWIFNVGDGTYLVPTEDIDVDQSTYTTTSTIFKNHNYRHDYSKIQLIKPAIVKVDPNTNPQTWRLQEQGELVFL